MTTLGVRIIAPLDFAKHDRENSFAFFTFESGHSFRHTWWWTRKSSVKEHGYLRIQLIN